MTKSTLVAILTAALTVAACFGQSPNPSSPRAKAVHGLIQLLEQPGAVIDAQARKVLAESSFEELKQQMISARQQVKQTAVSDVLLENDTTGQLVYEVGSRLITIDFELTAAEPVRVTKLATTVGGADRDEAPPLTWDTLEASVDQAASQGFVGTVLVGRDGEIALQKAYGFANREKKIKNTPDTVFAIGSAPIDFTHAGILLLKDDGKLVLDDPVTKFFADVPGDKQGITIRHLMTGRSGLPDFHDLPADENPDHTWIDRDEAVRRIMDQELLFEPGTSRKHSHSAWGLLAAIIELASGETYQQFTGERLFKPAGMRDTGFFGDSFPEDRVAVGYGFRKSSDPNSPPHWGPTSWLVMGSGGQVSTLGDMYRWEVAMRDGIILSPDSSKLYLADHDGVAADGDMFGFEFMHSRNPDELFMLISNAVDSREKRQAFDQLGRRMFGLVRQSGPPARYSLGIAMNVSSNEGVTVEQVVAGSAAENDGLQVGDRLVSANGTALGEEPIEILMPFLRQGTPIEFEVIRGNETMEIRVTPLPKK